MLSAAVVAEVQSLLAGGLSQRAVAARLEVSRATVAAIARREHPRQRGGAPGRAMPAEVLREPARRPRVRRFLFAAAELIEPLGVELRGRALARYRALRARRERDDHCRVA